ncbi:hypothetical protein V2J09_006697 [Rumex salicifolius]
MSKGFWMPKDAPCLPDGEMTYDNSSRIESKRAHQWFMDGDEADLFPNKKPALDVPSNSSFSGIQNTTLSPWVNVNSFSSVPSHYNDRLFDPETTRAMSFDERNIPPISPMNLNMGRKAIDSVYSNTPFGLSISHTLDDSRASLNYGSIRKVKVSQVKDSENMFSVPLGPCGVRADSNVMPIPDDFNKVSEGCTVSTALSYSRGEDNVINIGDSFSREADAFISMNQPCSGGDNTLSMRHNYKGEDNTMLLPNSFNKVDNSLLTAGQSFSKEDSSIISMSHAFTKGNNNMISMSQSYNRMNDNTVSIGNSYNKGGDNPISFCHPSNKVDSSNLSMSHAFEKGESNIISFGSFNDDDDDANASGRLISNYDLLMAQPSVQGSDLLHQKDLVLSDANALTLTSNISVSGGDNGSKKKDGQKSLKKSPSNNFPSNVRSLLSTGILDGVPVKYIAWSREKELPAIIRGSGYLCGCQPCNMGKIINAYEFERHAGCKTKHPNNHIYFENGKTIYGIVQELRSTPQNMLFDVIQTITGSPINQKSFRLWKESFLAATRELQRIYGKD